MSMSALLYFCIQKFQYVGLVGAIEILSLTLIFYFFSIWLSYDRSKFLLPYFYSYCAAALLAHVFALTTLENFLFLYSPAALLMLVVIHQETLQKNFILARNITPSVPAENDWLNLLMRSFLIALNQNKSIICVIEKHDSLNTVLDAPLTFKAQIQKDLFDILLDSSSFDAEKMIWVTHQGELRAINATWNAQIDKAWINDDISSLEEWKQDAVLLTNKTDALVFKINPQTRTVDLVAQKKILDALPINDAFAAIKKYLYGNQTFVSYEIIRGHNETISKKSSRNQIVS